jgi:flagellar basal-body rod protein FlgC
MDAMQISMSGLDVEWRRLQVIAQNIANINTSRTLDGGVYLPQRLVSGPDVTFESALQSGSDATDPSGVRVYGVEQTANDVRRSFDPDHPHANEEGFVTFPGVDHASEMALMIKTSRAYEANLTAMSIARQMYTSALEMGR